MTSKSFGWDSKTCQKDEKTASCELFQLRNNCQNYSNENSYGLSTFYWSPICVMASKSHGRDSKTCQKWPKNNQFWIFSIFSKEVETNQTNFSTVILHHARFINGQRQQNRLAVILETYPEVAEKWPKNSKFRTFFNSIENSLRFERFFYSHYTPVEGPICVQWHQDRMAGIWGT